MAHSTNNIIKLITTVQCPLIIDGTSLTADNLIKIADTAKSVGCPITIANGDRFDVESLIKIAQAGKGYVTLDLR